MLTTVVPFWAVRTPQYTPGSGATKTQSTYFGVGSATGGEMGIHVTLSGSKILRLAVSGAGTLTLARTVIVYPGSQSARLGRPANLPAESVTSATCTVGVLLS